MLLVPHFVLGSCSRAPSSLHYAVPGVQPRSWLHSQALAQRSALFSCPDPAGQTLTPSPDRPWPHSRANPGPISDPIPGQTLTPHRCPQVPPSLPGHAEEPRAQQGAAQPLPYLQTCCESLGAGIFTAGLCPAAPLLSLLSSRGNSSSAVPRGTREKHPELRLLLHHTPDQSPAAQDSLSPLRKKCPADFPSSGALGVE